MEGEGIVDPAPDIGSDISRAHPECPKCGLPTFQDDQGGYFCATCTASYDLEKDKLAPRVFRRKSMSKWVPISISLVVVILLAVSVSGFLIFLRNDEEGLIDIDDVSRIRGLDAKYDVEVEYLAPSLYDDYVQSGLDDDERRELWELERFYECMLVIDPHWNLVSMVENSSAANILAFYDTETEKITVIEGGGSVTHTNYILSHEYTHALQDQNFDLDSYHPTGSYDMDLARLAVVEGDAMITMELWARENLGPYERMKLSREILMDNFRSDAFYDLEYSNEIIHEMEYFPYVAGMVFVDRLHQNGGYELVNRLFIEDPPLSTEQIMHLEKYLLGEEPVFIDIDTDRLDMQISFETTAGEKLLTELFPGLSRDIGSMDRNRSDIGWGGDRFIYLENGNDFLSIFAVQWDTEEINDIFFASFEDRLFWEGNGLENGTTMINGNLVRIVREGNRTFVVTTTDPSLMKDAIGIL